MSTQHEPAPAETLEVPPIEGSVRRIIKASATIFSDLVKIVMNGNAGEAVRESANHL